MNHIRKERVSSIDIVRYNLDLDLLSPVMDYIDHAQFNVGQLCQSKDNHIHHRFIELFADIQSCLDHYHMLYQYDCDRILPTISWINVSLPDQSHPVHNHPNSLVSGILYLNTCTPTHFIAPAGNTGIVVANNRPQEYECQATEGDLVLFPSYLDHYTLPGLDRYTLSFNTMPVGTVNKGTLNEHTY